jgi:hypothetical protein
MAAVVPYLMPGVPLDLLAEGGGAPGLGLPDGVILRPALPPQPVAAIDVVHGFARVPPREMTIHDVRIGEGLVSIRMAIEYDGVQIDVTHLSGEPVSLWAELPQPPDFQIRVEYLDWTRRETVGEPVEMSVSADKQKRHLFGRFRPRALTWTDSVPDRFDARFARHGLRLTLRPDDPDEGRIRGFAAGLTALFEKPAEVVVGGGAAPSSPWPGIKLQLAQDDDRERKLDGLTSLAEHFALYRMNAD